MNFINKNRAKIVAMLVAFGGMTSQAAHAALDASVSTAITTAQTDLLALYAALTGAGVVIWVARLIYRHFRPR